VDCSACLDFISPTETLDRYSEIISAFRTPHSAFISAHQFATDANPMARYGAVEFARAKILGASSPTAPPHTS